MPRSPPKAHRVEEINSLWSDPEAEAYLLWPSDQPLPDSARLHQLLARTQQVLSAALRADTIQHQEAAEALISKAVVLLTRLLHMLQQQAKHHQFMPPLPEQPYQSIWFCIVGTLAAVVTAITPTQAEARRSLVTSVAAPERYKEHRKQSEDMAACSKQLEEYPGRLAIPLSEGLKMHHCR